MNCMSDDLRRLANEIQPSDQTRETFNLTPQVKQITEEAFQNEDMIVRHSINIIIPVDTADPNDLSTDHEEMTSKDKSKKKGSNNKHKKKRNERAKKLIQICANSRNNKGTERESIKKKDKILQSTTTFSPSCSVNNSKLSQGYDKFSHCSMDKQLSIKPMCSQNDEIKYSKPTKQCCYVHKYGLCDTDTIKRQFTENKLRWLKLKTLKSLVTREQVTTAIVNLSLPSPTKIFETGNDYSRHLRSSNTENITLLPNPKLTNLGQPGCNTTHRKILLPKKINLNSQHISGHLNERVSKQLDTFPVDFRFRINSSSNFKSSVF